MLSLFYPSYRLILWGSSVIVFVLACFFWWVDWPGLINGPVTKAESTGNDLARALGSFSQLPYQVADKRAGGVTGGSLVVMCATSLLIFLVFSWPNTARRWLSVVKGAVISLFVLAVLLAFWLGATETMFGWAMKTSISIDNVLKGAGAWPAYKPGQDVLKIGPTVMGHMLVYLLTLTVTLFIFWIGAFFLAMAKAARKRDG